MSEPTHAHARPAARSARPSFRRAALALLTLPLALAAPPGCREEDPASQAVEEAMSAARTLGRTGNARPSGEEPPTLGLYDTVAQATRSLPGDPSEPVAGAAAMIRSSALVGSASFQVTELRRLERRARSMAEDVLAAIRAYERLHAEAAAEDAIEPAEQIAELSEQAGTLAEQARSLSAEKAQLDSRAAALRDEIAALNERVASVRDQAGELQLQAARLSATEAVGLAAQIRDLSRRADGLEFQSQDRLTQAEMLAPQIADVASRIEEMEERRRIALDAAEALRDARGRADILAGQLRDRASQAAALAAERLEALRAFREGELAEAADLALSTLESAGSEARRAARADRENGSLATASALRARADALVGHASGIETYARLLARLADATPTPPDAGSFRQVSDQLAAEASDKRAQAADLYRQSADALRSGGSGADRDRLDATIDRVNALADRFDPAQPPAEDQPEFDDPRPNEAP